MSWWLRHIGWWPPLLGTGVKVTRLDKDLRAVDVEMRLRDGIEITWACTLEVRCLR
jgi:hypothetical protein